MSEMTLANGNLNGQVGNRIGVMLTSEQITELSELFDTVDANGDGFLQTCELQAALKHVGLDLPGYQIRDLIDRYVFTDSLTFDQFRQLYSELRCEKDIDIKRWKETTHTLPGAYQVRGTADCGAEETVHTIRIEEEEAFANWINSNLADDRDLIKLVPISTDGGDLYEKIQNGLVLCKLINLAVPETIDERAMNKSNLNIYTKRENLTLALMSALAIGCNIVNIDADDLAKGKPHLVLGLLWQIIRIGLFNHIDLHHVPGLFRLLQQDETLEDLRKLSPEQILLRWINYHLDRTGTDRRLENFSSDVRDSEVYTRLVHEIAPESAQVGLHPLSVKDYVSRAEAMLCEADKLGCRAFVTPIDVANGNYKLNLAFVANLFNKYSTLPEPGADEPPMEELMEESREEKTYRNWMNSMGVSPYVNWLYSNLQNGIVIFQLYDVIRTGLVDWKKVVRKFHKLRGMMDQIQNCNYAVDLGRQLKFSLVGIQGKDIYDGNTTLTLALVWQLMRAYTLSVLAQCTHSGDKLATDKDIVLWANEKLRSSGKSGKVPNFQDCSLGDARTVCDLIDAILPGTIDYNLVGIDGKHQTNIENAKYAITCGRKIGAKIYALPEDIVEVKPKMMMTVFACLMVRDSQSEIRSEIVTTPFINH